MDKKELVSSMFMLFENQYYPAQPYQPKTEFDYFQTKFDHFQTVFDKPKAVKPAPVKGFACFLHSCHFQTKTAFFYFWAAIAFNPIFLVAVANNARTSI